MYQLGKAKGIKWNLNLDESNLQDQTGIYSLINLLTYHLIEDNDEQLSSYLKELFQSLAEKNLHHLMRFGYYFLCQDIRIRSSLEWASDFEELLSQTYDLIHSQEQHLKSIYHSYREYYQRLNKLKAQQKYK